LLQVYSKSHRVFHSVPAVNKLDAVLKPRDIVGDHVWKVLALDNGAVMILDVKRSCEMPEAPPMQSCVRASSYLGCKWESAEDGTCEGGR
jgi:hypothetical protein